MSKDLWACCSSLPSLPDTTLGLWSSFRTQFKFLRKPSQIPSELILRGSRTPACVWYCPVIPYLWAPLDCLLLKDKYHVTGHLCFCIFGNLKGNSEINKRLLLNKCLDVFVLLKKRMLSLNENQNHVCFNSRSQILGLLEPFSSIQRRRPPLDTEYYPTNTGCFLPLLVWIEVMSVSFHLAHGSGWTLWRRDNGVIYLPKKTTESQYLAKPL